MPNNRALKEICKRYLIKYGIQIEVVESSSLATAWSRLKSQENKPLYAGIILTDPDKPYAHVCPILCHMAAEEECYIMDVLGGGYPFDFTRLLQCHAEASTAFAHMGVKAENIHSAKGKRQVDTESCRTGAVTLLRNALLWIKRNASNEESLKSILTQLKVQDLEYQIPLEWSYIEQIYPKNMDLSKLYVIRDFFK